MTDPIILFILPVVHNIGFPVFTLKINTAGYIYKASTQVVSQILYRLRLVCTLQVAGYAHQAQCLVYYCWFPQWLLSHLNQHRDSPEIHKGTLMPCATAPCHRRKSGVLANGKL